MPARPLAPCRKTTVGNGPEPFGTKIAASCVWPSGRCSSIHCAPGTSYPGGGSVTLSWMLPSAVVAGTSGGGGCVVVVDDDGAVVLGTVVVLVVVIAAGGDA